MCNVRVAILHDLVDIQIITKYGVKTKSAVWCGTKSIKSSVLNSQPSKCCHFNLQAMVLHNTGLNFQYWLTALVLRILVKCTLSPPFIKIIGMFVSSTKHN